MSSSSPLAFEQVTDQFNWVRRLAVGLCGEDRADDVAQETMFRALASEAKHDRNLRGWLATIARNVVAGDARKEGRRRELLVERLADLHLDESPEAAAEEVLARSEASRLVLECVEQLPREYRVATLMHYQEDLSFAEIAVALDATEKTIRHRVSRAQDKIRDMLRQRHGDHYLLPAAALVPRSAFLKPVLAPLSGGSALSGSSLWAAAALAIVSISAFLLKGPSALRVFGAEEAAALATVSAAPNDSGTSNALVSRTPGVDGSAAAPGTVESARISQPFIIQDPMERPLANADVIVLAADYMAIFGYPFDPASADLSQLEQPIFRGFTDELGQITVDAPPNTEYTIWVRKHGYAWAGEVLAHVGDPKPHVLTVPLAAEVEVQVVGNGGQPLAGALVHVFHQNERYDWLAGTLRTDENGSVTIGYASGPIVLQVYLPGYVHHVIGLDNLKAGDRVSKVIELHQGESRFGRIVDTYGNPVFGARIHVVPDAASLMGWSAFPMQRTPDAISDENGFFRLDSIPADRNAVLRIFKPGLKLMEIPVDAMAKDGEIVLTPHLTVDLQILAQGRPAFPAVVTAFDARGNSQSIRTDSQGRVQVGGSAFEAGEVMVQIDSPLGSLQASLQLGHATDESVTLDLLQEHSLLFDLMDHESRPISAARIQLIRENSVPPFGGLSKSAALNLRSDEFGSASCFVQPGQYRIIVRSNGELLPTRLVTVGALAEQRVEIRIGTEIPVQFALNPGFENFDGAMLHLVPISDSSLASVWVPVDSFGNTLKRALAPAKYQVLLYARLQKFGESLPFKELPPIEIRSGHKGVIQLRYDPESLVDATLKILAPASFGELSAVELYAIADEQQGRFLGDRFVASKNFRAHDGSMHVAGRPAGWYRVIIRDANGLRAAQRDVLLLPGQAEVLVQFTETPLVGRLHAAWLDQLGEGEDIRLTNASGKLLARLPIDATGGFHVDHVPAGQYILSSRDGLLTYSFELGPQVNGVRNLGMVGRPQAPIKPAAR